MPRALTLPQVNEVKKLLYENYSYRKIAWIVGISRATVADIASGKERNREPKYAKPDVKSYLKRGPIARCPTCGGLVQLPCLACEILLRETKRENTKV